jgi:metal-sulfur cluster biosynthetic enzyme
MFSLHAMGEDQSTVRAIWTVLGTVIDPELNLDVVTLGLVYDVELDEGYAEIVHTLTTPGCPMEGIITDGIKRAVAGVDGVARVGTRIVWDPSWRPGMIAPSAFNERHDE